MKATPYGPSETDSEYQAYVILTWYSPCKSNGLIEYFLLEFEGSRQNQGTVHFQREFKTNINDDGIITYNETNLIPEYTYNIKVSVKTQDVPTLSEAVKDKFDAPAGSE